MELWFADIWREAFPDTTSFSHTLTSLIRLTMAAFLGGLIGIQRQREHKPAGLRTYMLVSLGSALFVIVTKEVMGSSIADLSRVIQGVATGIGFLGGGAIVKSADTRKVKGLTSAAAIWLTAGLGVTVACGMFWPAIWIVLLAWIILAMLGRAERLSFFGKNHHRT